MRVRTAELEDVPQLVALLRANPTAARWTEEQFAKMVEDGEGPRVILVFGAEVRVEGIGAASQKQTPFDRRRASSRFARNDNSVRSDNPEREDADPPKNAAEVCVQGFAVANTIGPECEVENIVVNPQRQRHGLGQTLLRELLNHLRGKACEAVFLEVRESNRPARGLYEKCGFREVGRRVKYYVQPQEDAVVYRFCWALIASGMVQT